MNTYLTTPIYYASGSPHLGHAYTTFLADCYKRYRQLRGDNVLLISGTDEHGQKIETTAAKNQIPVKDFVDIKSAEFRQLWQQLNIAIDLFERTTDQHHKEVVVQFWQRLSANGDLYSGEYTGLYCIECEQYFTSGDICPVHQIALESFSEPCWFFRLSLYQQQLIHHIESHPEFILPKQRRNEVLSFLRNNKLHDLSISRSSTTWGIAVPGDSQQVLYVWIDALVTYISALTKLVGDSEPEELGLWLRNTVHFIGKDILTFHAVYWPALLLSAGFPLPKHIVVNGWLTIEGEKIAKSNPHTIIDPQDIADEFETDGLRYYFLRSVSFGGDSDFNKTHLKQTLNSDLANNIGNLVSRVISLVHKYHDGIIKCASNSLTCASTELLNGINTARCKIEIEFDNYNIAKAAELFIAAASSINAYVQQQTPWKVANVTKQSEILWVSCLAIRDLSILATPFIPELAQRINASLGIQDALLWNVIGKPVTEFCVTKDIKVYQRRT